MSTPAEKRAAGDARDRRLLDAALAKFARFGFRKTSMEEVARAARLSRQGLYLHFATKEELFREVVRHFLDTGLDGARRRLGDPTATVEQRLLGAFDEWVGRYVGMLGADVTDLQEASDALVGELVSEREERFLSHVTKAIRASKLPGAYKPAGLTARQLAENLNATARGLKRGCPSREAFQQRFSVAVRALCLPLRDR